MRFEPLIPVPVLAVVAAAVAAAVMMGRRRGPRRRPDWVTVRWTAMGVLALLVAIDPTIGGGRVAVRRSDANVLFVVDTTGSMAAEDYADGEPRLVGVRQDVMALADEFRGAHFSLITWNSKTRVIVPWTTDRGALDSAAALLRQEWTLYAAGSRLDEPQATMRRSLPRATSDGGYDVVFFLSDGEHTERPAAQSFEVLADDVTGGAVLGYGTTDGARMRVYIGRDEEPDQFIHDYETATDAISRIDEENLNTIASDLGVPYIHRTEPGGLGEVADQATDGAGTVYAGERDTAQRLYWLPAFGLVGLVLWHLAATSLEIVDSRRALGRSVREATR
jgi:Ca-activated chloride channel family protein